MDTLSRFPMPRFPVLRTWHVLLPGACVCAVLVWIARTHPTVLALMVLAVFAVALAWRMAAWRATLANVAILLMVLAVAEFTLVRLLPARAHGDVPAIAASTRMPPASAPQQRVAWAIGTDGMRIAPRAPATPTRIAWFFGCSVTFGTAVADDQTLPALFASQAGWRAHNFAIRDSGPHGMLRLLETRGAVELSGPRPARAIFVLLPEHIARVSGRTLPDPQAPRYVLDGSEPRLAGLLADAGPRADGMLMRSALWREIVLPVLHRRDAAEDALTLAILMRSHAMLQANHGVKLEILLWDIQPEPGRTHVADANMLESELQERGVSVIRASAALATDPERSVLFGTGGMPNATAYRKVARHLMRSNPPAGNERRAAAVR